MSAVYTLHPIGHIHSPLLEREKAPKEASEGAPDAWVEIEPRFAEALLRIEVGREVILLTWLHEAERDVLRVHPRGNPNNPLAGVFATRSPDRPNPIGLHRVRVLDVEGSTRLRVGPLEAIDGTPVVDIKPVLSSTADW